MSRAREPHTMVVRSDERGPAWVLLHGFTGRPESWRAVVERLPRDTSAAAIALFGHAKSAGEALAPASFDEAADELSRAIGEIANLFDRPVSSLGLAGYSLGARLALAVALRLELRRLVLVSGSPGLESDDERAARTIADERWAELLERDGLERFEAAWTAQPVLTLARPVDAARLEARRRERLGHDPRALARAMRLFSLGRMPNLWPELAALAVDTTLVAGACDAKFTALAERMRARIPRAHLALVEGAGHDLLLEAPEALAAILAEP